MALVMLNKLSRLLTNPTFVFFQYQKLRNRSRSGSSLLPGNSGSAASSSGVNTLGSSMAPRSVRPLVSASSNPDLSSAHSSALLAQLLSVSKYLKKMKNKFSTWWISMCISCLFH